MKHIRTTIVSFIVVLGISVTTFANPFFAVYDTVTNISDQLHHTNTRLFGLTVDYNHGDIDEDTLWQHIKDIPDQLDEILAEMDTLNETIGKNYRAAIVAEAVSAEKMMWRYMSSAAKNLTLAAVMVYPAAFELNKAMGSTDTEKLLHLNAATLNIEMVYLRLELQNLMVDLSMDAYFTRLRN